MAHVLHSATNAVRSLIAPGVPSLVLLSCLLSLGVLALLSAGLGWSVHHWLTPDNALIGWLAGSVGGFLITALLFPILTPIVVSFFDEAIAERVEQHAYPKLSIGTNPPMMQELLADVRFTGKAIALNLCLLPALLLEPLYAVLFYGVNGYLLGTQFFMMAGGRHIGKEAARSLAGKHRLTVTLAGLAVVVASQIPLLNIIAPAWAVALMVHLFQALCPQPQVLPAA